MSLINQFSTLNQFIDKGLAPFSSNVAYSCTTDSITYKEVDKKSKALASWFKTQGLSQGDRIVIQLPNLIQYPIAFYAALRAGLTVVNTNPMYTPAEMLHQFNDSGASAIVILDSLVEKLDKILEKTEINTVLVIKLDDLASNNTNVSEKYFSFNSAIEFGAKQTYEPVFCQPDDICILQYTGGTTGVSKGACLTHTNLIQNAHQTVDRLGDTFQPEQEILVCPLPLYHIYGLNVTMILYASGGNNIVLIPDPSDLNAFIESISNFKFTAFTGINTLYVGLCNKPKFRELDFSSMKVSFSGATTLTTDAVNLWKSVTGCTISEGYGLSETSPVLCFNHPGKEEVGTVGPEVIDTEIKFIDADGNEVPDNTEGELIARGPQIMKGYWNMPEETKKVFTIDGFFKTGDIAKRLPSGNIKIIDRNKDMIIVSGFNVYPNQIEDVITQHPFVLEAAVVGEPDQKTGEKVCAYITVTQAIELDEIVAFCRGFLTPYKVPKKIIIMDELPKSTVGKILRRELRK